MPSAGDSRSSRKPSPPRKPSSPSNSEMLSRSEIAQLKRRSKERQDYADKAFRKSKGLVPGVP